MCIRDRVGLYDKALSANEVTEIYNGGNNFDLNTNSGNYNSEANLIGYWKMNEGSGTTLTDHSGNGNDGNINNGPNWITQGTPDVITYTPNANYNGSDSFTFTVSDGEETSPAATVNISVTAVNDAPTASAQSASGNEDAAQPITLAGNDIDGDALTYVLVSNPAHGLSLIHI